MSTPFRWTCLEMADGYSIPIMCSSIPQRTNPIRTRTAEIWKGEDGVIRLIVVLPQAKVKLADAQENIGTVAELAGGKKCPVLGDIRNVKSAELRARRHLLGETATQTIRAFAILVGSPLTRVIGNFFMGLNRPPFPARTFTSEEDALEWLKSF